MELELPPGCAATYEVERKLASGGFGSVFLARHRVLERPVALKLLNPELLADREAVDRFVNEARITAQLLHPHIVVLLDHGHEQGIPWIAYEYLPATSLRARMRGSITPWREAFALGIQVASALAAAHAAGVLHRDIKPENVLMVDDDTCKVADFGTAKWSSDPTIVTGEGVILGTPAYMAPELVSGSPATPQSDVYALGAMLYELITGHVPFDGGTVAASLRDRLEYEPLALSAWRPDIPPSVDAAVLKAVARSRSDRYMTAQAFQLALSTELDDSTTGALAAYRRAAHASLPAAASGPQDTLRTVVQPRRNTALVPALELPRRGRVMLALSLATGVLGSVALAIRPAPRPPPASVEPAGAALPPHLAHEADRELDELWVRLKRRDPAEQALWGFLSDPSQPPAPPETIEAALEQDLAQAHQVLGRLSAYAGPSATLAGLRARAAGLIFQLTCRRDNCTIARRLPQGVGNWATAVSHAPHQFGAEAHQRLRPWLDALHDALHHSAVAGALDRRLALLVDEAWQNGCYVNHELEHFQKPQLSAAFERASLDLSGLPLPPLRDLARIALSSWSLPLGARREALERARLIVIHLLPRNRELSETLRIRIEAHAQAETRANPESPRTRD